jgi:hypothetical protein
LELDRVPVEARPALHAIDAWSASIGGDFHNAAVRAQLGLTAELAGGTECGWLHDVLAHVAYFQGDVAQGLMHSETEIERARRSGDSYRLAYALADASAHATVAGNNRLGRQLATEALTIAQQLGNPAVVAQAQLATAFALRDDDPTGAIESFRRAAALADTIESSVVSSNCRTELALLLSLFGDPLEAARLIDDELRAFRRAGDVGRVRGTIRHAIPALYRLLGSERGVDLVMLEAGTAARPHIRQPFRDAAIAEIRATITASLDNDVVDGAVRSAQSLTDSELAERALELIHEATATRAAHEATATRAG